MLRLTRLNREPIVINYDVVAYVEADPDTLVTLTNGEKLRVRESVDEVVALAQAYRHGRDPFRVVPVDPHKEI